MELRLANQHCISHNIQYDHSGDRLGEISQKLCHKTFSAKQFGGSQATKAQSGLNSDFLFSETEQNWGQLSEDLCPTHFNINSVHRPTPG